MSGFARILIATLLLGCAPALCADRPVIDVTYSKQDVPLNLDPDAAFWRAARPVYMDKDKSGKLIPAYRTKVLTRWTKNNLYLMFVCPYEELNLKPSADTKQETNQLWNWDVAEVFLGTDFADIKRYKEFEVSPQGEWIDLDIDLHNPHHEEGWTWNSGFESMAKIDASKRIWYAAMRIPYSAIDSRPAAPGNTIRANLFRSQGPPEHAQEVTWQPPMNNTFHIPERFGLIKLLKNEH